MTPPKKLEPGNPNDDYPVNDMNSPNFNVGGVRRTLPAEKQLEQLTSYLDATYELPDFTPPWKGGDGDPDPADRYTALLPDRITHAAMLMLGSAVDHAMPGVAYAQGVETQDVPEINARVFKPSEPTGRWAVSLHSGGWWRGSGPSLEHQWRPEVAAAAELSGTTIVDVDYPLAPQAPVPEMVQAIRSAIDWIRSENPTSITAWGYSSGGALAAMMRNDVDALVLTFPDLASVEKLPDDISQNASLGDPQDWGRTLVQIAAQDDIAPRPTGIDDIPSVQVKEYVSTHRVSTPEVARQRVHDVAEFLRSV